RRAALHDLGRVPGGTGRETCPVAVAQGTVDGDHRSPRVELVARGVGVERPRDGADVVDGESGERLFEVGCRHDPYSRHTQPTRWWISGFPNCELGVAAVTAGCGPTRRGCRTPTPASRRSPIRA